MGEVRDRRVTVPLPEVILNGFAVPVESQIQYRAADVSSPERMSDPEIRYSFKIPNTDLWKSGNITPDAGSQNRSRARWPSLKTMPSIATVSRKPSDGIGAS